MRTIPALACDVEEMFHTHKVTGKMQVSVCDRPGDKDIVLPGSAAYPRHDPPLYCSRIRKQFFERMCSVLWLRRLKKIARLYGVSCIKNTRTINSGLELRNAPPSPPSISVHLLATTEEPKSRLDSSADRSTPTRQDHRSSCPQWPSRNATPACPGHSPQRRSA